MELTTPPPDMGGTHWVASWGDKVQVGDLIKTKGNAGPVRVTALRRFDHNHPRPVVTGEEDNGHWIYGAVVQDIETGKEFHAFLQPHEPCFIGLVTPPTTTVVVEDGGPDGAIEDS